MVGYIDFSSWKGFGELWEQLRQRKYWGAFWQWLTQRYSWEEWESKNPSQRADVVLEFWKEKGELLDKGQANKTKGSNNERGSTIILVKC
jgi:hypothetical protein